MNTPITNLLDTAHVGIDISFNGSWISFGVAVGVNSFTGKKPDNLICSIEFLFWTLEIEINRRER